MGLTRTAARTEAGPSPSSRPADRVIALAGNPNVGKSTLFNALTGMRQHTGNWPGKTVSSARGLCRHRDRSYLLVDIPGTYSLLARSAEEEVARDALCFGQADAVVVVCDATCLERSLNLALQVIELGRPTVVCVNLLDEAERKGIQVDLQELSRALGVPVAGTSAGTGEGLGHLLDQVEASLISPASPRPVPYPGPVEECVARLEPLLAQQLEPGRSPRWAALRLLEGDPALCAALTRAWGVGAPESPEWVLAARCREELARSGMGSRALTERLAAGLIGRAEQVAARWWCSPGGPGSGIVGWIGCSPAGPPASR